MTHDKVRQDFKKFCADKYGFEPNPKHDTDEFGFAAYQIGHQSGYQEGRESGIEAGRAAERAEIREKLESAEVKEAVGQSILGAPVSAENIFEKAKAAITKILEVI